MATWYYGKDNDRFGPIDARELKKHAESGRLLPADLVWMEGMEGWIEARRVRGLFPDQDPTSENISPPPMPPQPPVFPSQIVDRQSTSDSSASMQTRATTPRRRSPLRVFGQEIKFRRPSRRVGIVVLAAFGCLYVLSFLGGGSSIPAKSRASAEGGASHFTIEITPPSNTSSLPRCQDPVTAFGENLRQEMYRLARQEQGRRQAARDESLRRLTDDTCTYCKGGGSYNYVDEYGQLRLVQCPRCFGRGRMGSLFGP